MNTNVKILLALGAIAAAIFGITVISSYTPTTVKPTDPKPGVEGGGDADPAEPVYYYGPKQISYNPKSESQALRDFPGFYEINDDEHPVIYWVLNPNKVEVQVTGLHRSCSACTGVRIAVFPPEPKRPEVEASSAAVLGLAGADLVPPAERARRVRDLPSDRWMPLDFDHPEKFQTIPPAAEDGTPTWVAIQLNFKANVKGTKPISASLGFKTPAQKVPLRTDFGVVFVGMPRFSATPTAIDFHEMGEKTPSKSEDIYYWSAIVPEKDLPPPKCSESPGEPFLTFSKPILLDEFERSILAGRLTGLHGAFSPLGAQGAIRVLGAYRITVTLNRKNPDPKPGQALELDIGPLEKTFAVFPSTGGGVVEDYPRISVKATVTGLVSLTNGGAIDLGSFSSREGTVKPFPLVSERLDLDLEVAADLIEPKALKAELDAPKNEEGRRHWVLKVRIDAGATTGNLPSDAAVVLRVKSTGQLVRLPAKGYALLR